MKTHTTEGARILRNTMRGLEDEEYLSVAIDYGLLSPRMVGRYGLSQWTGW